MSNTHVNYGVRGFTLVELITIIVILGILAVAAAPRFFDRSVFDSRGFYDQVIATVRYAQKTAIAKHRFVCVTFPAINKISLTYGLTNACSSGALTSPSGEPYPLVSSNASFSSLPPDFSFDCLGRPRDTTTLATCNDIAGVLVSARSITVNNYGASITVERETGYVH
ncbi:MAG: type II secretion system protein [Gallionellaceae bacterium]|nr:type II secretion system protein [Gallionellaceae bacterium]